MNTQNWILITMAVVLLGMMAAGVLALKQIETKLDRLTAFVSDLAGEKEPKS